MARPGGAPTAGEHMGRAWGPQQRAWSAAAVGGKAAGRRCRLHGGTLGAYWQWCSSPWRGRGHGRPAAHAGRRRRLAAPHSAGRRLQQPGTASAAAGSMWSSTMRRRSSITRAASAGRSRPQPLTRRSPPSPCRRWLCPPSSWRPSARTLCRLCTPTWPRTPARRTPCRPRPATRPPLSRGALVAPCRVSRVCPVAAPTAPVRPLT